MSSVASVLPESTTRISSAKATLSRQGSIREAALRVILTAEKGSPARGACSSCPNMSARPDMTLNLIPTEKKILTYLPLSLRERAKGEGEITPSSPPLLPEGEGSEPSALTREFLHLEPDAPRACSLRSGSAMAPFYAKIFLCVY